MAKPDPLVAALDDASATTNGRLRVDTLFGNRPEVLAAIRRAHERGVSLREIARRLSTTADRVSPDAIRKWLEVTGG